MFKEKNRKEKLLYLIDKAVLFFFAVLMFFLPVSNAAVGSCFGFIFLCFILKCVLKDVKFKENKFFYNKINLFLLIFYICIGLSLFVSGPFFAKSFRAWFLKWGQGVILFYIAQLLLRKKDIKFILAFLFISTFLACIHGLYQANFNLINGLVMAHPDGLSKGIRAHFNHYNDFASFLIAACFINLGMLFKTKNFWFKMALVILNFLVILNLLFTHSRGAWFSFLLVIFPLAILLCRKRPSHLAYVSVVIFCFVGVFLWIVPLSDRLFSSFKVGGDSDRFRMWQISYLMFKDSPFLGKGIGLFMDYLTQYAAIGAEYAHNCYLQILVETGIIGLVSFLLFLGSIIIKGFVSIIKNFDELFWGLFSGFLAFSIHSFFDTQLYSLRLATLFWVLASFITIYIYQED